MHSRILPRFAVILSIISVIFSAMCANAEEDKDKLQQLAQESSNPVGRLWMITNQFNGNIQQTGSLAPFAGGQFQFNWNWQPVLTFEPSGDWRLIVRPVVPVYSTPYPGLEMQNGLPALTAKRSGGLGDAELMVMVSPISPGSGSFVWGIGPTVVFPTASDPHLGQGQFQLGPALAAVFMDPKWVAGIFPQHWWSVGGEAGRKPVSFSKIEYFVWYSPSPGWQIGFGPNVLIDWMQNKIENALTLPVGLGVAKMFTIGDLPVKVSFEADYSVIKPQNIPGTQWTFKLSITPIIPKLF